MPDIFASIIVLGTFYLMIYKCRKKDKVDDKDNGKFKFEI